MITRADVIERVREWGLTEEVIEKDYVLGWLLWGIGSDPVLAQTWVFKGGTCLKKCYIETYRFSEDLDFTVLPGGPFRPDDVEPLLLRTLSRVTTESGIDFSTPPRLRLRPNETSTEGRVYYTGPRRCPAPARVKLDITVDEVVVRPPVLKRIAHPYPDSFPPDGTIRCYSFDELFAEKIRAMAQRGRPRDLYDIVNRRCLLSRRSWKSCRCCSHGSTDRSRRSQPASSHTGTTRTSRGHHHRASPHGVSGCLLRRSASLPPTACSSNWTTMAVRDSSSRTPFAAPMPAT